MHSFFSVCFCLLTELLCMYTMTDGGVNVLVNMAIESYIHEYNQRVNASNHSLDRLTLCTAISGVPAIATHVHSVPHHTATTALLQRNHLTGGGTIELFRLRDSRHTSGIAFCVLRQWSRVMMCRYPPACGRALL